MMEDPRVSLAEVGIRFGYYDHPHFIKDFRTFTGGVPGA